MAKKMYGYVLYNYVYVECDYLAKGASSLACLHTLMYNKHLTQEVKTRTIRRCRAIAMLALLVPTPLKMNLTQSYICCIKEHDEVDPCMPQCLGTASRVFHLQMVQGTSRGGTTS